MKSSIKIKKKKAKNSGLYLYSQEEEKVDPSSSLPNQPSQQTSGQWEILSKKERKKKQQSRRYLRNNIWHCPLASVHISTQVRVCVLQHTCAPCTWTFTHTPHMFPYPSCSCFLDGKPHVGISHLQYRCNKNSLENNQSTEEHLNSPKKWD